MDAFTTERLRNELDEFAALLAQRNEAGRSKVSDRAALRQVTKEILVVIRQLHTINRFRYREDAAALAASDQQRGYRGGTAPQG